jgi:hypothetical protein
LKPSLFFLRQKPCPLSLQGYFERFLLESLTSQGCSTETEGKKKKSLSKKLPKQTLFHQQMFGSSHSPFQEFSGANSETKAGLFVKTKSFGSNFNQNLAGVFVAPKSCLGGRMGVFGTNLH